MNILTIIPARGGSKRLPKKNILDLSGKPLVAWTILAAKESRYTSDIVVSTDDNQIAQVAMNYGVHVPFIRPADLSNETATSIEVVKHALNYFKENCDKEYDFVMLLQPTSPLRKVEDIDSAIDLLVNKNADSIISMCECEHSPLWANVLPEDYSINNFDNDKYKNIRSQDLPIYYRYNGAIYLSNVKRLMVEGTFSFKTNSYAYIMPQERSIDIDTKFDFKMAELILNGYEK